jgi:hypothetical protein
MTPGALENHPFRDRAATLVLLVTLFALIWGLIAVAHLAAPQVFPAPPTDLPLTSNQPQISRADYHRCADIRTDLWSPCTGSGTRLVTECAQTNIGEPYGFIKAPYSCSRADARPIAYGAAPHAK